MTTPRQRPPAALIIPAVSALFFFGLPLVALVVRTPWSDLGDVLTSPVVGEAVWLSVSSSVVSALVSVVIGVPTAWILATVTWRGRTLLRALVTLPVVLPPVVGGAALLFAFGGRGLVGGPLRDAAGIQLPFSFWGLVMAGSFVSMPFVIITVESAMRRLEPGYGQTAATLGASQLEVFRRVTLPLVRPAVLSGAVLAWARALGEFGATVTFAGNLPGRTQTLPLAVFVTLQSDRDAAIAISLVLVAISLVVLVALRDRWWNQ